MSQCSPRWLASWFATAAIVIAPAVAAATGEAGNPMRAVPETRLIQAMTQLHDGNYAAAQKDLQTLISAQPDFHLAYFLYGALLQARAGRPITVSLDDKASTNRNNLLSQARKRWQHSQNLPSPTAIPNAVLQLAPQYHHVVVVDLIRNRLYLFKNTKHGIRLAADFYATIGRDGAGKQAQGDKKTPVGVYHITTYRPGSTLPNLYGAGALPVSYPNRLDQLKGRTGGGIWVHGVPFSTYNRPPRDSLGCVAISNTDFKALRKLVSPGITPVVFTNQLQWLTPAQAAHQRSQLIRRVRAWRKAWESLNTRRLLAFYAPDFTSDRGLGKTEFATYKRQVNTHKKWVKLRLDQVSVFHYPADRDMALVSFTQHYTSNNFRDVVHKKLYWRKQNNRWQIMYATSSKPTHMVEASISSPQG